MLPLKRGHDVDTSIPRGVSLVTTLAHGEVVCAVAIAHPPTTVYTGGKGVVKVWDVSAAPRMVGRIECLDNYIRACILTRDCATLVVGGEARAIVVVDVATRTITGKLSTPHQLTYALCASKDSKTVFSCCSEYFKI